VMPKGRAPSTSSLDAISPVQVSHSLTIPPHKTLLMLFVDFSCTFWAIPLSSYWGSSHWVMKIHRLIRIVVKFNWNLTGA
jgi:hypothetical protein